MSQPSSSLATVQLPSRPVHISEDEPVAAHDAGATVAPDSRQVWPILAELDPQILRLADALAPFGQRYVDQLAAACFSAGEATHFPEIARKIVAVALAEQAANDRRYSQDSEERQSRTIQTSPTVARGGTIEQVTLLKTAVPAFRLLSRSQVTVERQRPQREDLPEAAIANAVPIVALDGSAEISGEADSDAGASNSTEKNLRKPLADDDDLQNMAKILDRLNEVLKTKTGP
jgi:hypothetical protein